MIAIEKEKSAKQLITVDAFDQFDAKPENKDRLFELIHGEIVEKMPTQRHGIVASNVNRFVGNYAIEHKNGRPGVEVRHQVPDDDHNARLPDVSFTRSDAPIVDKGSVPGMPDLAVKIKSPSDTISGMRETAQYYLENGSQLVWLIYPEHRLVEVYRPDEDVEILNAAQTLSGYDVMPGFEMPIADVFADPYAPDEDEESK